MSTNFSWTEHNGVWRRKLGGMESFYLALASPEGQPVHWMIGCRVSLVYHGKDSVNIKEALRQAWKDTRLSLPSLASTIDRANGEIVVGDASSCAVDEWLRKSFQVHDDISDRDLFSAFKSQLHITLHFLRNANQVMIQAPHALIDGRGILHLYHSLFTALSNQQNDHPNSTASTSLSNLTLPYDAWLKLSPIPSEKNAQAAESIFRRVLEQEQTIQLPGVDFTRQFQHAAHTELIMTEHTTDAIIAACKQQSITVTSAWHAALAMATRNIQSAAGERGTSYVQFTTIDLRRWFPQHFRPRQDSIGSLQTAIPFALNLEKDNTFKALSQTLHADYKDPFAFADHDFNYLTPYMAASKHILMTSGVPPSSTPSLSSMGVIDDFLAHRYGDWELIDFWISSTMLTGDFQMYLWTFRGRLVFSVCYNEAFYDIKDVNLVLDETRNQLLTGLGIAYLVSQTDV